MCANFVTTTHDRSLFMFSTLGVSAMAVISELALFVYRERSMSLKGHMQSLYDKYGEFVSQNGYYFINEPSVVTMIMKRLRCNGTYQTLRDVVAPYKIESIRDLGEPGYDSLKSDKKPTLPCSKSAPMLTIRFTNGCAVQLRPSGTEPKVRFDLCNNLLTVYLFRTITNFSFYF